jgi:hypothetical protein
MTTNLKRTEHVAAKSIIPAGQGSRLPSIAWVKEGCAPIISELRVVTQGSHATAQHATAQHAIATCLRLNLYPNQGLTHINRENPAEIPSQSSLLQAITGQRAFSHFLQPNTAYWKSDEFLFCVIFLPSRFIAKRTSRFVKKYQQISRPQNPTGRDISRFVKVCREINQKVSPVAINREMNSPKRRKRGDELMRQTPSISTVHVNCPFAVASFSAWSGYSVVHISTIRQAFARSGKAKQASRKNAHASFAGKPSHKSSKTSITFSGRFPHSRRLKVAEGYLRLGKVKNLQVLFKVKPRFNLQLPLPDRSTKTAFSHYAPPTAQYRTKTFHNSNTKHFNRARSSRSCFPLRVCQLFPLFSHVRTSLASFTSLDTFPPSVKSKHLSVTQGHSYLQIEPYET